jgi:hypothetical protein
MFIENAQRGSKTACAQNCNQNGIPLFFEKRISILIGIYLPCI